MPRDPNRIPILMEKINLLWEAQPQWRFGQLVENACFMGIKKQSGIKSSEPSASFNIFNIQDDIFELGLDILIEEFCNG
jgi:hypothetical protein